MTGSGEPGWVYYSHDGSGGVLLQGTYGRCRFTLELAKSRFEPIEAWRRRVADFPNEVRIVDHCMATLLTAIDAAEAWRSRQAAA